MIDQHPEEYDANESREEYVARMKEEGYKVCFPESNELFIDIDTKLHWETFLMQIGIAERNLGENLVWSVSPSRNGGEGRHVRVYMPFTMDDVGRIAWQAALGSDPVRELLSLVRVKRGDKNPTLFVERR